jgi:hypothetical protein
MSAALDGTLVMLYIRSLHAMKSRTRRPPSGNAEPASERPFSLVRVEGPVERLQGLRDTDGLILVHSTARLVEGGRASVECYADDEALKELAAEGVSIHVIQSKEQLAQHESRVRSQVEGGEETAMVAITGSLPALRRLLALEGLRLEPHHLAKAKGRRWTISAEATAEAIAFVRDEGFDVRITVPAEEMQRRRDVFYGDT